MHIMIQPDAAREFFSNKTLLDQGFLSRFLVAAPDSMAGTRFGRGLPDDGVREIKAFGGRILRVLEMPPPLAEGRRNELVPRVLTISGAATEEWWDFSHHVERQLGPGGALHEIKAFAGKAAEHAARMAGVMTVLEDHDAQEIDATTMKRALNLADWYVRESVRLHGIGAIDLKLRHADALLRWLQLKDGGVAGFREILHFGPNQTRTKSAAEDAISHLKSHGWVDEILEPAGLNAVTGKPVNKRIIKMVMPP